MRKKKIDQTISENKVRLAKLNTPYNPVTGEGSPIPRFKLQIDNRHFIMLPESMKEVMAGFLKAGSVKKFAELINEEFENVQKQVTRLRLKYDFEFWCWYAFIIQNKATKKEVPFVLNPPQRKYWAIVYNMIFVLNIPIRIIIDKARQWGGSTETQAIFSWIQTEWHKNWHSVIVTDVSDQARGIRGMYSRFIKNYPTELGTLTYESFEGSSNNKKIEERGCIIGIGSAQKPESLRSFDNALVHESEVGLWKTTENKSPEDIAQSLTSTVPDVPMTAIILESTAKGVGNFFHDKWVDAKEGISRYYPLFVAWFEHIPYQKKIDDHEKFVRRMNDRAWELWSFGATLEGIKWYFEHKEGEGYSDFAMMSEYPSNDIESFQTTGSRAIPMKYVIEARKRNTEPAYVGDIRGASIKGEGCIVDTEFHEGEGDVKIWELPDKETNVSERYMTIVDIGGKHKDSDRSVIKVFDRYENLREVCSWSGHIEIDYLAYRAASIAMFYNESVLIIESNTATLRASMVPSGEHSVSVIDRLAEFYLNLYARQIFDKVKQDTITKWGFHMNKQTKPLVVDALTEAMRDGTIWIRDKETCDQIDTFELTDKGTYEAAPKKFDDNVDNTAIACHIHNKLEPCKLIISTPYTEKRGSIVNY